MMVRCAEHAEPEGLAAKRAAYGAKYVTEFYTKQLFAAWKALRQQTKGLQRQAKRLRGARKEIERLKAEKAPAAEATEEREVCEELERLKQINEKLLTALKSCQFLIGTVTDEYERQNPLTGPTIAAYYDGANRQALEAIALAEGGKA